MSSPVFCKEKEGKKISSFISSVQSLNKLFRRRENKICKSCQNVYKLLFAFLYYYGNNRYTKQPRSSLRNCFYYVHLTQHGYCHKP